MLERAQLSDAGLRLIGLARRAGSLIPGMDRIRPLAEGGQSLLVLADPTLSERSQRELGRWAEDSAKCNVWLLEAFSTRMAVLDLNGLKAIGLTDEGFRTGVYGHLSITNSGEQGGGEEEA